jgi:hypothetical protein
LAWRSFAFSLIQWTSAVVLYAATILMALPLAIGSSLVSPMVDHTYKAGLAELAAVRGAYPMIAAIAKKAYNVGFLLADWRRRRCLN